MPINLFVRPAELSDTAILWAGILAAAERESLSELVTGSEGELAEHLFGPQKHAEAVCAVCEGRVVGTGLFYTTYSAFLTRPCLYLEHIHSEPDFSGRGVGKAILLYVARLAHTQKMARFEWSVLNWPAQSIAYYQKLGGSVLPDFRVCRVTGEALVHLATFEPRARKTNPVDPEGEITPANDAGPVLSPAKLGSGAGDAGIVTVAASIAETQPISLKPGSYVEGRV